jgi:hypothetical protein
MIPRELGEPDVPASGKGYQSEWRKRNQPRYVGKQRGEYEPPFEDSVKEFKRICGMEQK